VILLLDTHLLLWAAGNRERLSEAATAFLLDPSNELLFSAASQRIPHLPQPAGKNQVRNSGCRQCFVFENDSAIMPRRNNPPERHLNGEIWGPAIVAGEGPIPDYARPLNAEAISDTVRDGLHPVYLARTQGGAVGQLNVACPRLFRPRLFPQRFETWLQTPSRLAALASRLDLVRPQS